MECPVSAFHSIAAVSSLPSSITGNSTTDLDLRFGTRIRVAPGVTIGKVACADKTVLTDGVSCP
jgi:hypothetical protein